MENWIHSHGKNVRKSCIVNGEINGFFLSCKVLVILYLYLVYYGHPNITEYHHLIVPSTS